MSLVFYSAPNSSASPVASALLELDVPHERVIFDLAKKEQRSPEFLAINPNGKVPTLVADGAPMFEALAILNYLGDRYGVERDLWPAAGTADHLAARSWSTWAYVTYGANMTMLLFSASPFVSPETHHAPLAALVQARLVELLDVLEARLSAQPFMLGAKYSLLDLIVASVVGYGTVLGASVDAHSHVKKWLAAFQTRPCYLAGLK